MQQRLKPAARSARAQVIAAELFSQFLAAVDDAQSAFDTGFGGETPSTFTGSLEKSFRFRGSRGARRISSQRDWKAILQLVAN
jgi:hypothetical protein